MGIRLLVSLISTLSRPVAIVVHIPRGADKKTAMTTQGFRLLMALADVCEERVNSTLPAMCLCLIARSALTSSLGVYRETDESTALAPLLIKAAAEDHVVELFPLRPSL